MELHIPEWNNSSSHDHPHHRIKVVDLKILKEGANSYWTKIFWAFAYALTSFLSTIVNKIVLTSCGFPSSLLFAISHLATTIIILSSLKYAGSIEYPNLSRQLFLKIFPLPILFAGNVVTSLGGMKELSLPMFTALRRFAIFLTMVLEYFILKITPSPPIQVAVLTMMAGSSLAAVNDLTFQVTGYVIIMINNLFAASSKVFTKLKLETDQLGPSGLLFYNASLMIGPLSLISYLTGDFEKGLGYQDWGGGYFLFNLFLSCFLAFSVNLSIVLCTLYNSPLTTATVGCLKDILVTQVGMIVGGDYAYTFYNALGLNVGAAGSLLYIYITFSKKAGPPGSGSGGQDSNFKKGGKLLPV